MRRLSIVVAAFILMYNSQGFGAEGAESEIKTGAEKNDAEVMIHLYRSNPRMKEIMLEFARKDPKAQKDRQAAETRVALAFLRKAHNSRELALSKP